jgi:uncharacterized protein
LEISTAITEPSSDVQRKARRGLTVYLAIVVLLSVLFEGIIVSRPDINGPFIAGLMWVPAMASVVARLVLREGFSDVSFRFGGRRTWRAIGLALIFPTVIGLVAYGVAWTTGLAHFGQPAGGSASPTVELVTGLVLASTLWTALSSLLTAGEEIGWRGYMLTRLINSGVPRPVLASGLIWGLWHVPVVLAGGYAAGPAPVLSAVFIMVSITSFGYVIARLRLETGSIWPAIILHASWNSIIQGPFDGATTGAEAAVWVGESGILTALTLVVAAFIFSRGRWMILRQPSKRDKSPLNERRSVQG